MESTNSSVQSPRPDAINQTFPRSVLSASRDEFGNKEDNPNAKALPLQLNVKEGKLPLDLQGHVFIVSPVGSIDSPGAKGYQTNSIVYPSSDGMTPLYNGDGMIYRLDFDNIETGAFLTSRIVKPPCYYADVATSSPKNKNYQQLKFNNQGIARISKDLGVRNQLNTAFLPLKFEGEKNERLLITWDVGRPYEIDPKTLETVTPVGRNEEWKAVTSLNFLDLAPQPFEIVQTAAHPCFDPNTQEMFTVNIGRSLSNIFSQLIPIGYIFQKIFFWIIDNIKKAFNLGGEDEVSFSTGIEEELFALRQQLSSLGESLVEFILGIIDIFTDNFVDLIRWDGSGNFQKWEIRHNGCSIAIKQSIHQMAVTENYIVLLDTAFKVSISEVISSVDKSIHINIWKFFKKLFVRPQFSENDFYIIRRSDLHPSKTHVNARRVKVPREAAHFLADYKNPNDLITLHLSHVCAWDAAEWISKLDFDKEQTQKLKRRKLRPLYGAIAGPMDISKFGCYVINGKTGEIVKEDIFMDEKFTWGPAIYTYQNSGLPDRLEDIYWIGLGCWKDLKTQHMEHLYKRYKYRELSLSAIEKITQQGRPSSLLRLHVAPHDGLENGENRLSVPDVYLFPNGYWVMSPQFVPRGNSILSTDGYIVCLVHYDDSSSETNGNEIWIFDAANLSGGPVCKLWHPQFNVAFTIHTTWLQTVEKRTATYYIEPRKDYDPIVQQRSPAVQDLFEKWVYPKKETTGGH